MTNLVQILSIYLKLQAGKQSGPTFFAYPIHPLQIQSPQWLSRHLQRNEWRSAHVCMVCTGTELALNLLNPQINRLCLTFWHRVEDYYLPCFKSFISGFAVYCANTQYTPKHPHITHTHTSWQSDRNIGNAIVRSQHWQLQLNSVLLLTNNDLSLSLSLSLSLCFNGHFAGGPFAGGPGLAGTSMSAFWISSKLRVMEVDILPVTHQQCQSKQGNKQWCLYKQKNMAGRLGAQ